MKEFLQMIRGHRNRANASKSLAFTPFNSIWCFTRAIPMLCSNCSVESNPSLVQSGVGGETGLDGIYNVRVCVCTCNECARLNRCACLAVYGPKVPISLDRGELVSLWALDSVTRRDRCAADPWPRCGPSKAPCWEERWPSLSTQPFISISVCLAFPDQTALKLNNPAGIHQQTHQPEIHKHTSQWPNQTATASVIQYTIT